MRNFNRALTLFILFAFTGVGVTYAASNTNGIQNFFLGNAPTDASSVNQVLALLIGPQGLPGPAGVAGADGFVGLNGTNGLDGAPGPAGAAGTNGTSVAIVALPVGDADCPVGGSKLIDGTGATTFICNGRPGQPGAAGANGANGTNGTNGTNGANVGGGGFGIGQLSAGTCDDEVDIQLKNQFTGGVFSLDEVIIANIKDACATKKLSVYFSVRAAGALYGHGSPGAYQSGDLITCEKLIDATTWTGTTDARTITIGATDLCSSNHARGQTPTLNSISGRDLEDYVGFTIG